MNQPQCIWDAHAALGEGPMWSMREQALYWVDILNRLLHCYSPDGGRRSWLFDQEVSAVVERGNALLITQRHGFAAFDPATEELAPLLQVENDLPGNRFNNGKCDRLGRFWAGTMDFAGRKPTGSLYRLQPKLECKKMDGAYPVINGPAWSSDYRTMYHNDSANGRVYAFDYDLEHGEISNKRVFLQFDETDGSPDGMCADAEGGLWIAHWGAGKLTRHDSAGTLLMTITLPCSQITSCTFGGPGLRTLFITSAAHGLPRQQLEQEPLAGGLFAIELDIAGLPAQPFGG